MERLLFATLAEQRSARREALGQAHLQQLGAAGVQAGPPVVDAACGQLEAFRRAAPAAQPDTGRVPGDRSRRTRGCRSPGWPGRGGRATMNFCPSSAPRAKRPMNKLSFDIDPTPAGPAMPC